MRKETWIKLAAMALLFEVSAISAAEQKYSDGRPAATLRMDAKDHGIVLRYGDGPDKCDYLGARDVWVYEDKGTYYMHYDAAGPTGWLCSLATSKDMLKWEKKGRILIPSFPYLTMKAKGKGPAGPWIKQKPGRPVDG